MRFILDELTGELIDLSVSSAEAVVQDKPLVPDCPECGGFNTNPHHTLTPTVPECTGGTNCICKP